MLSEYFSLIRARGRLLRSVRRASRATRKTLAHDVKALGPWFHSYEIASGVWKNPQGEGPGTDYVAKRWGIRRTGRTSAGTDTTAVISSGRSPLSFNVFYRRKFRRGLDVLVYP